MRDWRTYLHERCITDETIDKFNLSWDGKYIHIPFEGRVRLYNPWPKKVIVDGEERNDPSDPKIKWLGSGFEDVQPPFPSWDAMREADILCEGEFDCMLLDQNGFKAATTSGGAAFFLAEWGSTIASGVRQKTMIYDNDIPGQLGMVGGRHPKTGAVLVGAAEIIVREGGLPPLIAYWPPDKKQGYDVTDWFKEGGDVEGLKQILAMAQPWEPPLDPFMDIENADKAIAIDYESENDLLGSLILGGREVMTKVRPHIKKEDFAQSKARLVYMAIEAAYDRGDPIDTSIVRFELERYKGNVNELMAYAVGCMSTVPHALNAETYAKNIKTLSLRRRAVGVARSIAQTAAKGGSDELAIIGSMQRQFEKLLDRTTSATKIYSAKELAMDHMDILIRRSENDPSVLGIPTFLYELDRYIAYWPGELWYVAAGPATGKTSFLKDLQIRLAKKNYASLFVSLEQPRIQLMDRMAAGAAKVDSFRISRGQLAQPEWDSLTDAMAKFSELPLYLVEDFMMTTDKLSSIIALAKQRWDIKVVYIDYVQLFADRSEESNEVQRIGYISSRLKQIAGQYNITLVVASQLNRAGAQPGVQPLMIHLRESGRLEQDAFIILTMMRIPDSYQTKVLVAKNRNGPANQTVDLYFDPQYTTFSGTPVSALPQAAGRIPDDNSGSAAPVAAASQPTWESALPESARTDPDARLVVEPVDDSTGK